MVTVKVASRLYQMDADKAEQMITMAGELVPCGIYAIRKQNYVELRNDRLSKTKIRAARQHYKKLGFKVYVNGL